MAAATSKRTRLSPEARRAQLLDTARTIILADGLQAFTMEALARAAGVSSPLVYNYFSGRVALLGELLLREYRRFAAQIAQQVEAASSFEEVVRVFVASNFDHHAPGNVLPVLLSQPDLAKALRGRERRASRRTATFLIDRISDRYPLTRAQAEFLVSVSSGASIAAASYCARSGVDREAAIDAALRFIFGGMRAVIDEAPGILGASKDRPSGTGEGR